MTLGPIATTIHAVVRTDESDLVAPIINLERKEKNKCMIP
jgi:hypothetical protein